MKDANYFAETACKEMTGDEQVKFRPLIYNLFLQAQAEAFKHAADVAEERIGHADVRGRLLQHAAAIWPGAAHLDPTCKPMMEVPSLQSPPDGGCPPAAA